MGERPRAYDRVEIARVIKEEGLEAAEARWPNPQVRSTIVRPIARALGVLPPYNGGSGGVTWDPSLNALLGTMSDYELAHKLLLPVATVRVHRKLLGIPTVDGRWALKRREWTEKLKTISDEDLAMPLDYLMAETGIAITRLSAERVKRGVVAFDNRGRSPSKMAEMRVVVISALKTKYPDITMEEIGDVMGISRERVRQLMMRLK